MIGELFDHLLDALWLSLATALPVVAVALACGLAASFLLSTLALQDEGATRLLRMIAALAGALWIAPIAVAPLLEHATASFASARGAGGGAPAARIGSAAPPAPPLPAASGTASTSATAAHTFAGSLDELGSQPQGPAAAQHEATTSLTSPQSPTPPTP